MELIKGLEMPPSCRTQWVSAKAKEVWEPRVAQAASAYWRLERETVRAGIRGATTGHISPDRLAEEMLDLQRNGFYFMPKQKVGSYSGFAHRHPAVEQGRPWNWYGPIGGSPELARQFIEAELAGDHRAVGKLLGYPECCQNFFSTVWMAGYVDPVWQAAESLNYSSVEKTEKEGTIELAGYDLHLTWFGSRYNGLRLTPHLACSFNCEATKQISRQWIDLGRSLKIPGLDLLVDLLSMPTEWNARNGIAWVSTPIFRLVTNTTPCAGKFIVRKHGDFIPEEAARGLRFPFLESRKGELVNV